MKEHQKSICKDWMYLFNSPFKRIMTYKIWHGKHYYFKFIFELIPKTFFYILYIVCVVVLFFLYYLWKIENISVNLQNSKKSLWGKGSTYNLYTPARFYLILLPLLNFCHLFVLYIYKYSICFEVWDYTKTLNAIKSQLKQFKLINWKIDTNAIYGQLFWVPRRG